MVSTLLTGWLIGATAAGAAPLPRHTDPVPGGPQTAQIARARIPHATDSDRDADSDRLQREVERAREEAERERERAQAEAERAREQAQADAERARAEAERAREQAQTEGERAREQAERDRQRAQEQAQRTREQAQEQAQRAREQAQTQAQRAREQAQAERERTQERAQRERERAQEQAQAERERAQERGQRERERAQEQAERERERAQEQANRARRGREYVQHEGDRMLRSFTVGRNGSLLLHNVSGDIIVNAGNGSEIRVEAFRRAKGRSDADARQQLENVVVNMREAGGGRVEVRTEHRGRENRGWVDFNITLPADAGVEVHSVSGDVTVTGVKGELRAESVSGDVRATGVSRLAVAKSLSGDVTVNNAESDATLMLSSVSGGVTATNLKARAVDANSVSGDTVLRQCTCERVTANSTSGSIEFSGRILKTGRYEMKTHSGDISLQHLGSAFDLTASTFSGDIRFDPAVVTLKAITNRYGPGRSVRGSVGGGGAYVELNTFSGDIVVTRGQ